MDNAQTNDPDNPTLTILNGNERVDGLELQATVIYAANWELFAGYSLLDGRTLSSGTAAYVGKSMPNVAHNALNLWTEYYLPFGIEVGGGGNWLGRRFADSGGDCPRAGLRRVERHGVLYGQTAMSPCS